MNNQDIGTFELLVIYAKVKKETGHGFSQIKLEVHGDGGGMIEYQDKNSIASEKSVGFLDEQDLRETVVREIGEMVVAYNQQMLDFDYQNEESDGVGRV